METLLNEKIVKDNDISDFISEEQRTYFSKKLYEGEQYDKIHTETYTPTEFHKAIKEEYGL